MRKFNSKQKHHRLLLGFLTVCLIISMSNMYPISANAATGTKASDAAIDLAKLSDGAELASGVYYLPESKTFGDTNTMNNGLKITSGATVYIYVPEGVTLTAIGGGTNTARQQGGYAGILLPSSSTLIILGEGKVEATGGRAGNGESGSSGSKGTLSAGSYYYGGAGGAGGAGGGGAGAGIGTDGGYGGYGGSSTGSGTTEYDGQENYCGSSGNSGGAGGSASSCGKLYIQDTISLTATGGTYGSRGTSGSAGSCSYSSSSWDDRKYHVAGGGGGGAGGGAGYSAYGIGTGGAAGGGGGSGGRGGIDYSKTSYGSPATYATCNGGGGTGGYGYTNGSNGNGTRDAGEYDDAWDQTGGTGGSGGSAGATKSTQKSALTSGWTNKTFSVTFKGINTETVQQTTYTFGEATQTITVPAYDVALADGSRFTGWRIKAYGTSPTAGVQLTDTDTRIYQPGDSIEVGAWLSGSIVLEPVVSEINCKVYFDDNGGSAGQGEALLKSDMTMQANATVPTRVGYDFLGYYTGMVSGTQYYNETGARVYHGRSVVCKP